MQETPRPTHMSASYPACSPSAIPAYPVPSTAAGSGTGGHSPPPTPGLTAQQPSPSPSSTQMPQTHLLPTYSTQSIPSTPLSITTSDAMNSPTSANLLTPSGCTLPTPQDVPHHIRGGDREAIIGIMIDLMGSGQKEAEPPTYMYANPPQSSYSQLDSNLPQASSPYIPVTSPSASSDQPCYSPVTPVQSPANCKLATWKKKKRHQPE